jgi:16S rRNA (uracil1498-N3)-methyltransferase
LTIPRIYSPEALENRTTCELGPDNLKYLKQVMRLKDGDRVNVFDGFGHEFEATIKGFTPEAVLLKLEKAVPTGDKKISITLAQAIPKARKMDEIVKCAAELGADAVIPFEAARSVSRISGERGPSKVTRWQKIATEAARSSRSSYITKVSGILSFADMLALAADGFAKLIFWEEESQKFIKDVLTAGNFSGAEKFFIIVGPEGGFSRDEITMAREAGVIPVTLGRQILKVETAAAVIIAIIQYEKGIFGNKSKEAAK